MDSKEIGKEIEYLEGEIICGMEDEEEMQAVELEIEKLQEKYHRMNGHYFRSIHG